MNNKTNSVLNGWLKLNDAERAEFEKAVSEYKTATPTRKIELSESVTKMQTGPLNQGCACCGR